MADLSKFYERADKALQKGKLELALEAYEDAIELDPRDERSLETAADLSNTLDDPARAAELFDTLIDLYLAAGNAARAQAIYKKLTRIHALPPDKLMRYATLIERHSPKESQECYATLLRVYQDSGEQAKALQAAERMMVLEPTAEKAQTVAELRAALGDNRGSSDCYIQQALLLERNHIDASESYRLAYEQSPSNLAARFGYGKALLARGDGAKAVELLEPLANYPSAPIEAREPYVQALMLAGRILETEDSLWELFELKPEQYGRAVIVLIGIQVSAGRSNHAVALARRLEIFERRAGRRREFLESLSEIAASVTDDAVFLQYMAELYNGDNREQDYLRTLDSLFDIYMEREDYGVALRTLESAVEVYAYDKGHPARLMRLKGHIEDARLRMVASILGVNLEEPEERGVGVVDMLMATRPVVDLSGVGLIDEEETEVEEEPAEMPMPSDLEDLVLDAEISLTYGVMGKVMDNVRRMLQLYPTAGKDFARVRDLLANVGMSPEQPAPAAPAAAAPAPVIPQGPSLDEVTAIGRLIVKQSTPQAVLKAAVSSICDVWKADHCVAGLCAPGRPPSLMEEHYATAMRRAELPHLVRLIAALQTLCARESAALLLDVATAGEILPELAPQLEARGVASILAITLLDGDRIAGLLILERRAGRVWKQEEASLLPSVASQTVLAVNNARLRSLVSRLAVSDEKSGLLNRSSYLDMLLSEVERSISKHHPLSLALMQMGKPSLWRELGEKNSAELMRRAGQLLSSQTRQSDATVHYETGKLLFLLPETSADKAEMAVDKFRRALNSLQFGDPPRVLRTYVGIAEIGEMPSFDACDVATEVINRVEQALSLARTATQNGVMTLPCMPIKLTI